MKFEEGVDQLQNSMLSILKRQKTQMVEKFMKVGDTNHGEHVINRKKKKARQDGVEVEEIDSNGSINIQVLKLPTNNPAPTPLDEAKQAFKDSLRALQGQVNQEELGELIRSVLEPPAVPEAISLGGENSSPSTMRDSTTSKYSTWSFCLYMKLKPF